MITILALLIQATLLPDVVSEIYFATFFIDIGILMTVYGVAEMWINREKEILALRLNGGLSDDD